MTFVYKRQGKLVGGAENGTEKQPGNYGRAVRPLLHGCHMLFM
jgi:hypothetical protein